jgi:glycosyltransferase involved in cell wall biosynthesis
MLVTVITPSKNQGKYIKDCLESVHRQSHKQVEHLVLDGMSTDGTATICKNYPSVFLQKTDTGPAQAINRGMDLATGDIVCWLNADDAFFGVDTLKEVSSIFDRFPEVQVVTGCGYYISEDGRLLEPIIPDFGKYISERWLRRVDCFLQPATFWRRNTIRLDESLHYTFDWRLWLDFYRAGLNILYVPTYFGLYRLQPSSLTQQATSSRKEEIYNFIATHGNSRVQRGWCWMAWKAIRIAELTRTRSFIRIVNKLDAFVNAISGSRINSGH